jgi:hypothetical protein
MNLIDEAENLMLHQFSKSPKLIGLIRSLVTPLEECDQALASLHQGRYISEACWERLDILGRLVNQLRQGMGDDDYRAWIQVAIKLNISSGRPEDVLDILKILYGKKPDVLIQEHPPNDVVFTFLSLPKAPLKTLFAIIRSACPVSTKCHFVRADTEKLESHE